MRSWEVLSNASESSSRLSSNAISSSFSFSSTLTYSSSALDALSIDNEYYSWILSFSIFPPKKSILSSLAAINYLSYSITSSLADFGVPQSESWSRRASCSFSEEEVSAISTLSTVLARDETALFLEKLLRA